MEKIPQAKPVAPLDDGAAGSWNGLKLASDVVGVTVSWRLKAATVWCLDKKHLTILTWPWWILTEDQEGTMSSLLA